MKQLIKEKIGEIEKKIDKYLYFFPFGLIGMEDLKEFYLLVNPDELPFYWMVSKNQDISFVIVSPFIICPNYVADIPDEEIGILKIENEKDIVLAVIVNRKEWTANLIAPIIFNQNKNLGKQVIISNYKDFNVKYPISYAYIDKKEK